MRKTEYPDETWDGGDFGNYDENYDGYEDEYMEQEYGGDPRGRKRLGMRAQVFTEEWAQEVGPLGKGDAKQGTTKFSKCQRNETRGFQRSKGVDPRWGERQGRRER
nr:pre-mRNA 3' end processing protein WDR33-like [Biomphalaria glabrata]